MLRLVEGELQKQYKSICGTENDKYMITKWLHE